MNTVSRVQPHFTPGNSQDCAFKVIKIWNNCSANERIKDISNGFGKEYFSNGALKYEGQFKDGLKSGYGKLYNYLGMLVYEGEFSEDHFEGEGKLFNYLLGYLEYEGHFRKNQRHGKGKSYYPNGIIKYVGDFEFDRQHGKGKFFDKEGKFKCSGLFFQDTFKGDFLAEIKLLECDVS